MKFKVPHTLVLLFFLMIFALILTWIIPSGEFQTEVTEQGREMVVPGTFTEVAEKEMLSPLSLFTVVPRALADAQGIIFFVLIIGGALAVVRETGAIDALLGKMINRYGDRPFLLLFFAMFAFAAASATLGMAEEYIPFAVILISVCTALRLDAITAIGTMVVGYGIGYGVALMNPFTLLVAQEIAELQPVSGIEYRAILAVPFLAVGFHHVWSYARKIQADPSKSLMAGAIATKASKGQTTYPEMTNRHIGVLAATFASLILLVFGIYQYAWYLIELGAMFFALAVLVGIISKLSVNETAKVFGKGASELTATALLIGFARSIALLLEDGEVLHTVVNALATPLASVGAEFSAVGMLFIQSILNFFIPSGSGQAFVTMPLMAPIGDLVGVSRQISVLAFQFGDGLMNMIVPTNPVLMGILGLAGISYDRWFKFIGPLIIKLLILASISLVVAVWIGYS
ncbi:YfcC family protein [Rhodohalobacter sp.]|uniref:YfcC family protein n=1 Tax=Rhodohalobacter sp. TaxID=1974210 RepID=UPI002ACD8F3D|nr:TIGR00366 family protein [Rhodohalobacter sp.]MDZ7757691.1 TIGR00366 family protein [Rhodohalobacter sp.]